MCILDRLGAASKSKAARMPRKISRPTDLLLRVHRGPTGLIITSPQLPNFLARARGPVEIASGLQAAFAQLDCDAYAARKGQPPDLVLWDAACDKLNDGSAPAALAASGVELRPEDVTVSWTSGAARRASGAAMRPMAVNGARHDPMAWTDLGAGFWQSPGGHRYREESHQVQRVIAQRTAIEAAPVQAKQQSFDDLAAG